MIVPRPPLLLACAVVLVPLAGLLTAMPGAVLPAGAVMLLFAAVTGWDAWRSTGLLRGIRVRLPALVRLQKGRSAEVEARVEHAGFHQAYLRLGLPFPAEVPSDDEDQTVRLARGAEASLLRWHCLPGERGPFFLRRLFLETSSPLGFWAAREQRALQCELRVFPDFLDDRKHVAALFLNRGHGGTHAIRQAGKGREFEKLREYTPGDSADSIHWKASAKRGRPVTKVYQVERTQEVYVLVDTSRLMARDPAGFERYVTSAMLLAVAAQLQGDAFGLLTFADQVQEFVRARKGQAQFQTCRDALYGVRPRSVTPDYEEVMSFIRTRLRKRSLLIFLTALDDPGLGESFARSVELICRQHLVLVNMLQPPLARPLFTGTEVQETDEIYARLAGHLQWHDLRELGQSLLRRGVRLHTLESETMSARLISQYVEVRNRQLL